METTVNATKVYLPQKGTLYFPQEQAGLSSILAWFGFRFGNRSDQGVETTLPPGWSVTPLDETLNLWELLDDHGYYRALFPKIDPLGGKPKNPRVIWQTRFEITLLIPERDPNATQPLEPGEPQQLWAYGIMDNTRQGTFASKILVSSPAFHPDESAAGDAMELWCEHWLDEQSPKWREPFAYWPL